VADGVERLYWHGTLPKSCQQKSLQIGAEKRRLASCNDFRNVKADK
jgi:hypothetical protein